VFLISYLCTAQIFKKHKKQKTKNKTKNSCFWFTFATDVNKWRTTMPYHVYRHRHYLLSIWFVLDFRCLSSNGADPTNTCTYLNQLDNWNVQIVSYFLIINVFFHAIFSFLQKIKKNKWKNEKWNTYHVVLMERKMTKVKNDKNEWWL